MIEVVRELQKQGHDVEYYVRKDGGILVKEIDGQKFPTGASGNAMARQIVGAEISSAIVEQLKYAGRQRGKRQVRIDTPDNLQTYFKEVKKKWSRKMKAVGGKPHPAGYFSWNKVKKKLRDEGEEAAFSYIAEKEKYASGIAYSENVRFLVVFTRDAAKQYNSSDLSKLADDIEENANSIKEASIQPAYRELYTLNQGADPKDVARNTRKILGL